MRSARATFRHNAWLEIPPLAEVIALHEAIANPLRRVRTIAVSLNTADLSDADARAVIDRTERETGLPTTDPVRYDINPLSDAVPNGVTPGDGQRIRRDIDRRDAGIALLVGDTHGDAPRTALHGRFGGRTCDVREIKPVL